MNNWNPITTQALNGAKINTILATAIGAGFDVNAAIADVTSQLRSAVNVGNELDADPTKIPNGVMALGVRMVLLLARTHLEMPMKDAEKIVAGNDSSYLRRIIDEKLKFEAPDTPAGNAEMQQPAPIQIASRQERPLTDRQLGGLL